MSTDEESAALAHQAELERRRFDEEQELLRADPAYTEWLEQLKPKPLQELTQ